MARRSDHSRKELTAMAIGAARDIINTEGVHKLSVRKVAGRIGYSPGTLYNIFRNMDDLVIHVAGETLDALYVFAEARFTATDPREALYQLAGAYLAFIEENPNLWDVVVEYRLPDVEILPPWYLAKVARLFTLIERAIAPLFHDGNGQHLHRAAVVLWASMQGLISLAARDKLGVAKAGSIMAMTRGLVEPYVAGLEAGASENV